MAFTEQQKRRVLRRLGQVQTSPRCPRCNENKWVVEGPVDLPFSENPRRVIPAAAVICDVCGYIDLVSMTAAGQVTLPAEVRDGALVELRPTRGSLADLAGSVKTRRTASLAEIEDAATNTPSQMP